MRESIEERGVGVERRRRGVEKLEKGGMGGENEVKGCGMGERQAERKEK